MTIVPSTSHSSLNKIRAFCWSSSGDVWIIVVFSRGRAWSLAWSGETPSAHPTLETVRWVSSADRQNQFCILQGSARPSWEGRCVLCTVLHNAGSVPTFAVLQISHLTQIARLTISLRLGNVKLWRCSSITSCGWEQWSYSTEEGGDVEISSINTVCSSPQLQIPFSITQNNNPTWGPL